MTSTNMCCHYALLRGEFQKTEGKQLEPTEEPLIEEIRFGVQGLLISLWSGFLTTVIVAAIIVIFFLAINILALLAASPQDLDRWMSFLRVIPLFTGITIAFLGLVGFPLALIRGWSIRTRRVSIDDDAFRIESAFSTTRLPFTDCFWSTPELACDSAGFYLPGQRLIVVCSTDARSPMSFACGFTDDSLQMWTNFLLRQGIQFQVSAPFVSSLRWVSFGTVLGGTLGFVSGTVTSVLLGKPIWFTILGLLGILNGCICGWLRVLIKNSSPASLRKGMSKHNWLWALGIAPLSGFVIGMKIGILDGLGGGFAAGATNAIAFCWMAWSYSSALRNRSESDEARSN